MSAEFTAFDIDGCRVLVQFTDEGEPDIVADQLDAADAVILVRADGFSASIVKTVSKQATEAAHHLLRQAAERAAARAR